MTYLFLIRMGVIQNEDQKIKCNICIHTYVIPFVFKSLVRVETSGAMRSLNISLFFRSCSMTITTSADVCGALTLTESPASTDGPLSAAQ